MKAFLFISLFTAGVCSAATLTVVGTPATAGSAILPSTPGTDWGLWAAGTNPSPATASITSTAGTRTFAVTTVGGTGTPTTRGSASLASTGFTFSNGDTSPSGSGTQVGGVFNTSGVGENTLGTGVALSLTSFTTPVRIQLYTYVFQAAGALSVYLDGNSTAIYSNTFASSSGGKPGYVYTFDYIPDSPSSTLRFEQIKTVSNDVVSSNVGFLGIAITPIPEVSSLALAGAGLILGLSRRRR